MTTLAEKIDSLSPERRARVEERANELIAQERARRVKRGTKRVFASGSGPRVHASVKPHYVRRSLNLTVGKRSFRGIRRVQGRRSRGAGYRRYISVAR